MERAAAAARGEATTVAGMAGNPVPVLAGNLVGGSALVALVYWVIYSRGRRRPPAAACGGLSHS
ncbi:MAG TPA: hypothetical protein VNK67_00395 [Burkholderiales bacterium]|nr:hypothetical protein [Burkholderiales bacterium]